MYCIRKITDDLTYIGGSDRRLALFENVFPVPRGVSYNSYLLQDEKTVLFDTVDNSVASQFLENLRFALDGRKLDYLVINHMEPDHCSMIAAVMRLYPDVTLVGNAKTQNMLGQFFDFESEPDFLTVKEGDSLETGRHSLTFVMAPMVHWPEAMATYDKTDKILFSADAFGTFGALSGNIFADELDFERGWEEDARRYYTNIVGKYGAQVQQLLTKAAGLDIAVICPLHGPVWRENIEYLFEKYQKWSTYTPEESGVVIAYASVYGNTENAAEILACRLAEMGVSDIKMFDVSVTHPSYIVAEAFKRSHLVFAAPTYNSSVFCNMETLIRDIKEHNLQNRTVAFIGNGSWAPTAAKQMREIFETIKGTTILENSVSIKSSLKSDQLEAIAQLAEEIVSSME